MTTETDLVRIRQYEQKLRQLIANSDSGKAGQNVYITYNASNLEAMPTTPSGDGTGNGWNPDPSQLTDTANWMSTKTAFSQSEGTWSIPMAIRGADGAQGLPGLPGEDAIKYYIKPTGATAIIRGTGAITVEAHRIAGSVDALLTAGTIKLYDPSNNEVTEANGYAAGSDGYIGVFDSSGINESITITLKNGPTGIPLDTITLIDIYDGIDGEDGFNGADGVDGTDGVDGVDGVSIIFQGSYASVAALISAKGALQDGCAYYNTTDKKSYVYRSPTWYQMTVDGLNGINGRDGNDGLSIVYHGDASVPNPAWQILNHCYRDTDNGRVYIWTGAAWQLMVADGTDGENGTNGIDGNSVFITYNDNAIDVPPATPTGNGTTGGWHTNPTNDSKWISQKIAASANEGTWGNPIPIKGADGTDAIIGSISSDNGLAWIQAPGPGAWNPAGTSTKLTVTYYQSGVQLATRDVIITRSDANLTAPAPDTINGITYSRLGNGTSTITITFTYNGINVAETVYAVAGATNGANGQDGEDGVDAGGLSADVPILKGIKFVSSGGKIGWTTGTIEYGSNTYNIAAKVASSGDTNTWIYWDADDQNTTFKTTSTLATAIAAGNWVVCKNKNGIAVPTPSYEVLLAGLAQFNTLSAINANFGNMTAGQILLTNPDNLRKFRFDNAGIYISNDGTNFLPLLYVDSNLIKLNADYIKAGHIEADRIDNSSLSGISASSYSFLRQEATWYVQGSGSSTWSAWNRGTGLRVNGGEILTGGLYLRFDSAATSEGQLELYGLMAGGSSSNYADYTIKLGPTVNVSMSARTASYAIPVSAADVPNGYYMVQLRYRASGGGVVYLDSSENRCVLFQGTLAK